MMAKLPGYLISECIYEGVNSVIYRARKESDLTTVIVKTLKAEHPTIEEITRLRHEYKILQQLTDIKGIVRAYSWESDRNGLALILEDFGGISFKKLTNSQKIPVLSFLPVAIQIADTLQQVHQHNIIHKDINPQNILLDPETWTVKLIDFSIASRLGRETPTAGNPDLLEGTLPYISPEATGRMNRLVDYRTDVYSLGVTFYEMLVGELPFPTKDSLELVHCHIAKNPIPPHHLCPEIPKEVSDIVMMLMAKNAEDRYQSALGIKVDLETSFHQLCSGKKFINFTPGKVDRSGQFLIPQKLYGREKEVASLLEAFHRAAAGTAEMVLVSGYSGIGKTSVVREVHKPIAANGGYFISGKFDQFKKNIPHAALIQAFQELIRQLLTESDRSLAEWKEKLLEALENNGQVMVDVILEVERIIGKQPPVPALGSAESQNRFNRVFQKFIGAIAQREHPLVLFLDDLQWADSASLKLIESVTCDSDSKYLLLIGAYRDSEVSPTHPTIASIDKIRACGATVNNIVLQPLNFSHVIDFVCDTLGETPTPRPPVPETSKEVSAFAPQRKCGEPIDELAELVYNKTQGNPFFITQFLQAIHAEGLFQFDFQEARWLWKIEEIHAIGISDLTIVELLARNLQKLPKLTQEVLKLAACMGNQFTLENLAAVSETSVLNTADKLWEALQAGLVLPLSKTYKVPLFVDESERLQHWQFEEAKVGYKFLHDRVQHAAYSLIPDEQKKNTHLKIGQLLLQKTTDSALEENIFDIVNQLNMGADAIAEPAEKHQLAALNLIAGRKAKAATAFEAAVRYLNVGLRLLSESSWQTDYDTTLALHVEAVEAEYISTNYERAQQLCEVVIERAKTLLEKVKVYETRSQFYIAQNRMQEAIDTALDVLKMLGVSVPKEPSQLSILTNSLSTKWLASGKQIEDLAKLPEMTDPYKIAAMRLLITVLVPAFLTSPNLFPIVTFKMVNLSVRYGNSPQAAYGYALYGWLLCGALGDINAGYQFGQLAVKLLELFNALDLKCKVVNIFNAFIRPWKEPLRETIEPFVEALQMSLEAGNIEYAGYSVLNYCCYILYAGEHLETVATNQQKYIDLMQKLKQDYVSDILGIFRQTALNLQGKSDSPCSLIGESFNEEKRLPVYLKAENYSPVFTACICKSMLSYLFKNPVKSLEEAELAEKYAAVNAGFLTVVEHNFYYSLALLAGRDKNTQALKKVELNQKKMKMWAACAPENYRHKYELVEAEKARVLGQDSKAIAHYDRAIHGAKESGYIQEAALAAELAAEFYFSRDRDSIAAVYLIQSYYSYIRWGAKAKVKDLESRYPDFFARILDREEGDINIVRADTFSKTTASSAALDLVAIARALDAIARESVFDRLLSKLMQLTIQTAGASKGLLFSSEAGQLRLVVEGAAATEARVLPGVPVEARSDLPLSAVNYVARTGEIVALHNATVEGLFANDPYILQAQPKSIFCLPLLREGKVRCILYLENNLTVGAFTERRLEVLKLLISQASKSLDKLAFSEEMTGRDRRKEARSPVPTNTASPSQ